MHVEITIFGQLEWLVCSIFIQENKYKENAAQCYSYYLAC